MFEKTGGRGVDILLESIGGEIFEQNFECLAPFGRYIIFGSTRGPGKPFEPRRLMQKHRRQEGVASLLAKGPCHLQLEAGRCEEVRNGESTEGGGIILRAPIIKLGGKLA